MVFDIGMYPHRYTDLKTPNVTRRCGMVLECAARANNNEPGLITAYDRHGSQVLIDDAFLGKCKPGSLEDYPFFRELRPTNFPAPGDFEAFAYRAQHWQGHVVFGGQDAVHGQRAGVRNVRAGGRVLHKADLPVDMCPMLTGVCPCPINSYMGKDNQSSVQATGVLNDCSVPDTWDSAGILAFQYEMSLVTGAWLASRVMTPEQSFENALTGYHGLLLQVMRAKKQHNQRWQQYTYAGKTLMTFLSMCGNMCVRYANWSMEWPWDPSRTQEDGSEFHYSETKACTRGVGTQKLRMRNTHIKHWKQAKAFTKGLMNATGVDHVLFSPRPEECKKLAQRALQAACVYHCLLNVESTNPETLKTEYLEWWRQEGHAFVMRVSGAGGRGAACSMDREHWPEENAMEEDEETELLEDMAVVEAHQAGCHFSNFQ